MKHNAIAVIVGAPSPLRERLDQALTPLVTRVEAVAGSGGSLEPLQTLQPNLVLVDLSAPRRAAGLDLVRQIRRRWSGMPVIGMAAGRDPELLLDGLRAGMADFLDLSNGMSDLEPAVRRALARSGETAGPTADVVALFSLRGGQGLTSMAINLADQIRRASDGRVLLFDLNLHLGDVGLYLQLKSGYTPYDLLRDLPRMDENLLFSSLDHHPSGLYVLTAPEQISDAEKIRGEDVGRMIDLLRWHFDVIFLDLPHDFSERTLAAVEAADRILVVTQQGTAQVKSTQSTLDLFRELGYDAERVRVVINRYDAGGELRADDLARILGQDVFATVVNEYRTVNASLMRGRMVAEAFAKKPVCADLRCLAHRLAGRGDADSRNGGWQRLWRWVAGQ